MVRSGYSDKVASSVSPAYSVRVTVSPPCLGNWSRQSKNPTAGDCQVGSSRAMYRTYEVLARKASFFMVAQTAVVEKSLVASKPVTRVRRWVRDHYEWVTLTQQQIEQSRRRAAYVAMFDPCGL